MIASATTRTYQSIEDQVIELLGQPVQAEDSRGWAHWWCPFHPDSSRAGQGGSPNFGVNLRSEHGHWKCLRCSARGGGLNSLRKKLGRSTPVSVSNVSPIPPQRPGRGPSLVDASEAISECRAGWLRSPQKAYAADRGIRPITQLTYGLGAGQAHPKVSQATLHTGRSLKLVGKNEYWLWDEGVVYADPPAGPRVMQVRHLRDGAKMKYQTWGKLEVPLGAWRLKPGRHLVVVVVEGMFDMLAMAQAIQNRDIEHVVPVYTGGASVSRAMLAWFAAQAQSYGFVLVPDDDGQDWTRALQETIRSAGGITQLVPTPDGLDPDEALAAGWWPEGLG